MPIAVLIFGASALFVAYVLAGYPLLLWILTRGRRAPAAGPGGPLPRVSVLLPVRNGEHWLAAKLETIRGLDYPPELVQLIVVDDGSTDRSAEIASGVPGVELVRVPPRGKAAALNAGLERATGEVLFFTDVRQELSPDTLRALVARLASPRVGVVSGELIIRAGETHAEAAVGLYWRYEKWIRRHQSQLGVVPGATGCVYAMRRSLAVPLPPTMLVDDMFLPIAAALQGFDVVFEPSARAYDQPTDLRTEFRRKVRTLAGNFQILATFPRLLLPVHRLWPHFVSHKVARLVLPYALIVLLATIPFLPWPWPVIVGVPAAGILGLAWMDPWLAERSPLKRLSSPVRAILVLMIATVRATTVLLPGRRELWTPTRVGSSGGPP